MKTDPAGAGLDERQLDRITEHLQGRYVDAGRIAGCQVVVARHGHVGYFASFGSRDLERSVPVQEDTIWRIYSMTKPITGVALMMAYERGMFQLNDPVTRFIPQWGDLKVRERAADGTERLVSPRRPMTVRDLLMHMSGLGFGDGPSLTELFASDSSKAGGFAPGSRRGPGATLESMIDRYAGYPLDFHPGTHWSYTISTDVCARLVEIISGQRFDDYLREHIFTPLGMTDTGFTVPAAAAADRFAACYRRDANKKLALVDDPRTSRYLAEPTFLSGGGGLVSTTTDYLRFCQMLCNGGHLDGVRILGRKTVELMTANHLPGGGDLTSVALPGGYGETGMDGNGFGLTVAVTQSPVLTQVIGTPGEFTWGGAASTIFWVDPAEELVVIFMTQLIPSGAFNFRGQLKTLVYPALLD